MPQKTTKQAENSKEKADFNWKTSLKWLVAFFCALSFAIILDHISNKDIAGFDQFGYQLATVAKSPTMTKFMRFITEFGGFMVIFPATLLLIIFVKNKRLKWAIAGNIGGILIVNQIIKLIIQRPRPDPSIRLIEQSGFSFPSGHSMCSMAFYGFLIYLVYRYSKKQSFRIFCSCALALLIFLIGLSRIYLGVHYTSDVIAGFAITIAYLIFYISLINFINYESRKHHSSSQKEEKRDK